ncbi:MAG TPA: hypothetical protein VII99_00865, partial [Bacteroidia bacterium]
FSLLFIFYFLNFFRSFALSQPDSSHAIHIGADLVLSPAIQTMDNRASENNFLTGILMFANFDNVIEIKTGGLYHIKKYTVYDLAASGSLIAKTEFHYINIPVQINFCLIRTQNQWCYLLGGFALGLPINQGIKWQTVDYMYSPNSNFNNKNFIYKIGMGYKRAFNTKRNYFFGIESSLMSIAKPIAYGDYYSAVTGSIGGAYAGTLSGNHSKTSWLLSFTIAHDICQIKAKKIK